MICTACRVADYTAEKALHGGAKVAFWICIAVGLFTMGILWVVAAILWAMGRDHRCEACGATQIPINSPTGRALHGGG